MCDHVTGHRLRPRSGALISQQPQHSPQSLSASTSTTSTSQQQQQQTRYIEVIGKRYKILQRIGKGSYGTVFKAVDIVSERLVALKRVESEDIDDIVGEIAILEQVKDPHIVEYLGNFLADDYLWIAMEYMSYGSVSDVMRLARIPYSEIGIATICRDILHGPHNMLFGENGIAKIADFGVSGQLSSFIEKRTTITGTPYYIAPEILAPNSGKGGYDIKADIWSLGISAIEMAQGSPPHYNLPPMKALLVIPNDPPPTLDNEAEFSREFNSFIASCLIKDPERRPTAEKLLLHPFIASKAVNDPWTIHSVILQKVKGIIESEGGLEAALKIVRQEEKAKESRAFEPDALREKEEYDKQTIKRKKMNKIAAKLKNFFIRRPKKEEIIPGSGNGNEIETQESEIRSSRQNCNSQAPSTTNTIQTSMQQQQQQQQFQSQINDNRWHKADVIGKIHNFVANVRPRTMFLGVRASMMFGNVYELQQQQQQTHSTATTTIIPTASWNPNNHRYGQQQTTQQQTQQQTTQQQTQQQTTQQQTNTVLPHWHPDRHKHRSGSLERGEKQQATTTSEPSTVQTLFPEPAPIEFQFETQIQQLQEQQPQDLDLSDYEQQTRTDQNCGIHLPRSIPPPSLPPPFSSSETVDSLPNEEVKVRRRSYTLPLQPIGLTNSNDNNNNNNNTSSIDSGINTEPITPLSSEDIPPPPPIPPPQTNNTQQQLQSALQASATTKQSQISQRRPLPRTPSFQN